jgi:hypothetical protein
MKTLLIPQLNYLGCFLVPNVETLRLIQLSIDKFVMKNLNISVGRRYLPPEKGGLGIFELSSFLLAQRCSWIKRAHSLPIDNWRFDLRRFSPSGRVHDIRTCDINQASNPILYNIVSSFSVFIGELTKQNNNYLEANIVDNPAFKRGPLDSRILDCNFFSRISYYDNLHTLRSLTYSDCYLNGSFKSQADFLEMGLNFTQSVWMRLRSALSYAKVKLHEQNPVMIIPMSVQRFLDSFKKGSKKFRIVMAAQPINSMETSSLVTVTSFSNITETPIPSNESLSFILCTWNVFFLPNYLREFIFMCRNNQIRVGARAAHFLDRADGRCTFCKMVNANCITRETFNHFFFLCPITNNLLRGLTINLGAKILKENQLFPRAFWYGDTGVVTDADTENPIDKSLQLFYDIFRYSVWKFKLRRQLPLLDSFTHTIFEQIRLICNMRPRLREDFAKHFNREIFLQALG